MTVKAYFFWKERVHKYPSIRQAGTSKKARMEASIYKFQEVRDLYDDFSYYSYY
jgi:hypothetical protein